MDYISLKQLDESFDNYELIYEWCRKDYIYKWFEQRILSFDEIKLKYSSKIKNRIQTLFFIMYKNTPIGLVQCYISDYEEYLNEKNVYEFDLFIGKEEFLSKGLGKIVINKINKYLFDKCNANKILLRPFKSNVRACLCYEKCGFILKKEYIDFDTLGNKVEYCLYELERK